MLATKKVPTSSGDFVIAPLTLRQVEDSNNFAYLTACALAINNANPEVPCTEDGLKDLLSLRSVKELAEAVMDLSGLAPVKAGEDHAVEETSTTSTAA